MKNNKLQKYRRSFLGTVVVFLTFLLLFGCDRDKNTDKNEKKSAITTMEVTTSCTTSTTISTTSNLTTSSTTTTTSTTTTELMMTEIATTIVWESIAPIEPTYVEPQTEYISLPIQNENGYSENDAILLAQLINKEASASYDGKVAVGSVVINRANYFGQSITDVIYAPNQFTTAYSLGYYTTDDYNAAVQVLTNGSVNNAFYFDGCHPDHLNHFRDINNNYVGAW